MLALNLIFLTFSAILFTRIDHVTSHGRLINPPQRSSAFRYGYNTPANYNDNQLFCGGVGVQYGINNGNCGACGDPYNADVKPNEDLGGLYVTGVITGTYVQGGQITAEVQLTAYHKGWFEFRLCPLTQSSTQEVVTQACLDQHLLTVAGGTNTRVILNETYSNTGAGYYSVTLQLPANVHCDNCVLQWKYNTGNSWGCFPNGGQCCVGCGPQENFINCADIRINPSSTTTSTTQSTSSSSQSATMSALTSSTTVTSSTSSSSSSSTEETTSTTTTVTSPTTSSTTTVTSPTTASTTTVTSPTTSSTTTVTSPTTSSTTTVTSPTTSSATTTTTQAQTTTTNQSSSNYGPGFTCSGGLICAVSNTYLSILTMPAWCCSVCEHTPPYCPASHCSCH